MQRKNIFISVERKVIIQDMRNKGIKNHYFDAMQNNQAEGFNKTKKALLAYLRKGGVTEGSYVEESLIEGHPVYGNKPKNPILRLKNSKMTSTMKK